jgi:hypothetical protein
VAAAGVYGLLAWRVGRWRWNAIDRRLSILQQVEDGHISAEEAGHLLEGLGQGGWIRLDPHPPSEQPSPRRRHLRIRVSDPASGHLRVDLRLPVGLVHTVLHGGGRLSADLSQEDLHTLLACTTERAAQEVEIDGERVEVQLE